MTLVEQLRGLVSSGSKRPGELMDEAADEITRLNAALQWEQNRSERIGTHGPGCHLWGPSHHECLLRKFDQISRMESEHCAYLVQENERLNKLLEAKHYYHGGIGLNQLRQIEAQAALLKQCWGYFNEIRMNDDQNRWTCDQAIAAIEQYERGE